MATQRRNIATEKTPLDQDEQPAPSNISPAVPSSIIAKLLAFTFAMITFPISTYFLTKDTIFKGNSTFAGASAAVMANVVLIGYVIVAFKDDQAERAADAAEASSDGKKSR